MEINESTIRKFFERNCTPEEAEAVARYFREYPEQLNNYFESEWNAIEQESLTEEDSAQMLSQISRKIKPALIYRFSKAIAVAAAVLLVIGAVWWLNLTGKPSTPLLTHNHHMATQLPWQTRANLGTGSMKLMLEDGSMVKLEPTATIRYHDFKTENKRDIYLSGASFFKVAKDKTKPFTVFAGGVATTAVGTQFNVSEKNGRVTVQLFEGKVRIKAATTLKSWREKELYLLPGQEFIYDGNAALFEVRAIPKAVKNAAEKIYAKTETHTATPLQTNGNWYMFNNQSLNNVFEQLEEIYNVKIEYDAADVKNVYLIGRFEKTDSLETILNNIALLKKLKIRHTGNNYVITRKSH